MGWKEKVEQLLREKDKSEHPDWQFLSRATGISSRTVEKWPDAKKPPSADVGIRIAHALGVSADWLYDDKMDFPAIPPATRLGTPELVEPLVEAAAKRAAEIVRERMTGSIPPGELGDKIQGHPQ